MDGRWLLGHESDARFLLVRTQADVLADLQGQGRGGVQAGPLPGDAHELPALVLLRAPHRPPQQHPRPHHQRHRPCYRGRLHHHLHHLRGQEHKGTYVQPS